jgi:hypothetical protein
MPQARRERARPCLAQKTGSVAAATKREDPRIKLLRKHFPCFFALLVMVGCASDPAPTEQLRLTEQALSQARAVGASEQTPGLALAERKLAAAIAAMKDERYREARLQAEQAELDARLAEATVLNEKSQLQAAELNRRIARLREQLGDLQ